MTTDENKLEILRRVENGTLTIEEGSDLIGLLDRARKDQSESGERTPPQLEMPLEKHETSGCWKAAWSMILVGGAILSAFSAYWLNQGFMDNRFGWGFWLSWIPLIIGIAFMILGGTLMESPWMHIRIRAKEENKDINLVLSMPVPFNIARWVFKNFGQYMPKEAKSEIILSVLDQAEISIKNGEPFQVQVVDDKDGSKVEVYIN